MAEPILDEQKLRKGLLQLRQTLEKRLGGLVDDKGARALRSLSELYMTEAKKDTPVKYGVLRASGHVQGPTKNGKYWETRLVFGGPSARYAVAVHENLKARHKVGKAKYLEDVIVRHRSTYTKELAAFMIGGSKVYGSMFG